MPLSQIVGRGLIESSNQVCRLAEHDLPTLIIGATGTGKELLADEYASAWLRKKGKDEARFGKFNCTGFSDQLLRSELFGSVEGAYTGAKTRPGLVGSHDLICLDELGDTGDAVQAQLLRVVEYQSYLPVGATKEEKFNGRFIGCTNRPDGIRHDLASRFHTVEIPQLALRPHDIAALVLHFGAGKIERVKTRFATWASAYTWPANARELLRACEEGALTGILDIPSRALRPTDEATYQAMQFVGEGAKSDNAFPLDDFPGHFLPLCDVRRMDGRIRMLEHRTQERSPDQITVLRQIARSMQSVGEYASRQSLRSFAGPFLRGWQPLAAGDVSAPENTEKMEMEAALRGAGNLSALAEQTGVPPSTLRGRAKRLGIKRTEHKRRRNK